MRRDRRATACDRRIGPTARFVYRPANPEHPEEVLVSGPSDAVAARAATATAFTALFFGLGAVALLVGGLGVANVMLMAVFERRSEIGLRRASGRPAARSAASSWPRRCSSRRSEGDSA
jgi:putative ABC transport system permease protein